MEIAIDEVTPGVAIRGRLLGAPDGSAEVAVVVTKRSPFDERSEIWGSVHTHDGGFELRAPRYPPTWNGELLGVEWSVTASTARADALRVLEIAPSDVTVESVSNDDFDAPAKPFSWTTPIVAGIVFAAAIAGLGAGIVRGSTGLIVLAAFVLFFSGVPFLGSVWGARERSVLGHVRCRVDPVDGALECIVRTHPPAGAVPDGTAVTATLIVAELASRSNVDRGATEREEVVVAHEIELTEHANNEWRGSIPLDVAASAPLSRSHRDGAVAYAVSWVVRLAVDPPRLPAFVRVLPLLALPSGLDPRARPQFVEIPKAAR